MNSQNRIRVTLALAGVATAAGIWYLLRPHDSATMPPAAPAVTELPAGVDPVPATQPATESTPAPAAPPQVETALATAPVPALAATPPQAIATTLSPTPAQPVSSASPATVSPTELATERMIIAHAPLRKPALADPDSPENRQVLQTMLQKALLRNQQPPPSK